MQVIVSVSEPASSKHSYFYQMMVVITERGHLLPESKIFLLVFQEKNLFIELKGAQGMFEGM